MARMVGAWWWVDRWRKSTAFTDMNAEEQGVYRNLLDEVWLREGHVIPDEDAILAKVSGDPAAWPRVRDKVLRWMKKTKAGWTHETALEIIGESRRRAEKQQRYRDKWRNGNGNDSGNGSGNAVGNNPGNRGGSPSPSPSPSPTTERTEERKANQASDRTPPKPNPLTGPRDVREREFLALVREAAALTGMDPIDIAAKATHYEGARGRKINPATMTDDRLLNSISDLRELVARERAKPAKASEIPPQANPADSRRTVSEETRVKADTEGRREATRAWGAVTDKLRARLSPEAYASVFEGAVALDLVEEGPGRTLLLEASPRTVLYAQSVHGEELQEAIEAAGLDDVVVEFRPREAGGKESA